MYAISSIKQLLDTEKWNLFKENKSEQKLIIEEIIEKLGIKPEDPEQLEGNIFMDTIFTTEFYPFDNHTELANSKYFKFIPRNFVCGNVSNYHSCFAVFKTYVLSMITPGTFVSENINYLYHYNMAFPTENGLPFIYTLTIPQLIKFNSGGSYKVLHNKKVLWN